LEPLWRQRVCRQRELGPGVNQAVARSITYGGTNTLLLSMFAADVSFIATQLGGYAGQIFSIASYSYEFAWTANLPPDPL